MAKSTKFDAADYLNSPDAIAAYLSEAFETGDEKFIAEALGTVARARSMSGVARKTGLSREGLYKSLSQQGRPELSTAMTTSCKTERKRSGIVLGTLTHAITQ
jgi:probable addiction module antidote protein